MNWAWSLHFLFFIITSPLAYSLFSFQLQASVMLNNEKFTSLYFNAIKSDTNLLAAFLHDMPKGGDLHNHLSGSVYAESYIAWAADDGLCINTETLKASSSEAGCSGDKIKM